MADPLIARTGLVKLLGAFAGIPGGFVLREHDPDFVATDATWSMAIYARAISLMWTIGRHGVPSDLR